MELELIKFVEEIAANGVKQGSAEWHHARKDTFGGSSIAAIIGQNPYSSITNIIRLKVGLEKFGGDIKTRWGNLFEDIIKTYTEKTRGIKVYGEDLYYQHSDMLSYSPDGLCVMNVRGRPQICLLEFKCPYSRIPTSKPPGYYTPQVKMGLELLKLPTVGILIEAVFRLCTREMFNSGAVTLNPLKKHPARPLAKGVTAFWYDSAKHSRPADDIAADIAEDIGVLDRLLEDVVEGNIKSAYKFVEVGVTGDPAVIAASLYPPGAAAIGYLPWKLLTVTEHHIEPEPGYLDAHMSTITTIDEVIKKCRAVPLEERDAIIEELMGSDVEKSFC